MSMSAAIESAIARAGTKVATELTRDLQARALGAGISHDAAAQLWVAYKEDGSFVCGSDSEEFDKAEYGDDGRPPLGLLRRFEVQLPKLATEKLDEAVAAEMGGLL